MKRLHLVLPDRVNKQSHHESGKLMPSNPSLRQDIITLDDPSEDDEDGSGLTAVSKLPADEPSRNTVTTTTISDEPFLVRTDVAHIRRGINSQLDKLKDAFQSLASLMVCICCLLPIIAFIAIE